MDKTLVTALNAEQITDNRILEMRVQLGKSFRDMRKKKRITLKELADVSGVNFVSIARFETGERGLQTESIIKLCIALGIELRITKK